MESPKGAFSF